MSDGTGDPKVGGLYGPRDTKKDLGFVQMRANAIYVTLRPL